MSYFYLMLSIIGNSAANIFGGYYTRGTKDKKDASALYSFIQLVVTFLLWLVLYFCNFNFDVKVLPYALTFGGCFAIAIRFRLLAYKTGPVMLSSLLIQLSLIAVCIWGLIFWGEPFSEVIGIGLVLVVISLWLCLYKGKEKTDEKKKVSWKWIVYCALAFIGNAGATIVQRAMVNDLGENNKNMLMAFATLFATILLCITYMRSDRSDSKEIIKTKGFFPVLSAVFNVVLNYAVMELVNATPKLSASLIYPAIGVGGLIITSLFSFFAFKEQLKWWQWIGVGIGMIATAILA